MNSSHVGSLSSSSIMWFKLVMPDFFLNEMSQLVDFVDEASGLSCFVHSICSGVRDRPLSKVVIIILNLSRLLVILVSLLFLTMMLFPFTRCRSTGFFVWVVYATVWSSTVGSLFRLLSSLAVSITISRSWCSYIKVLLALINNFWSVDHSHFLVSLT